jgi:hypothetical protein
MAALLSAQARHRTPRNQYTVYPVSHDRKLTLEIPWRHLNNLRVHVFLVYTPNSIKPRQAY